jgi:antitoxin component YwqK of YwqJK toxin-antitoxin module
MIRLFFLLSLFIYTTGVYAQAPANPPLNQKDAKGKPQGQWVVQYPARMGEDAYAEWGNYEHGIKYGTWYKFDGDAQVTAIEHFRNGVLDGEVKYFERGTLVCVGNYRGLNPRYEFDTIFVNDPVTNEEFKRIIPTDRGQVKQGLWRFYDAQTGRLEREVDYQLDEVLARQDFAIAAVDSSWYQRRIQAMPHNQKKVYKPSHDRQIHYTDFR